MEKALERVKVLVARHYERALKTEREKKLAKVAKLSDALEMPRERTLQLLTEHGFVPKEKPRAAEIKEATESISGCIERIAPLAQPGAKIDLPFPSVNLQLLSRAVNSVLNLKVASVNQTVRGISVVLGDVARKPKPAAVAKKLHRLQEEERRASEKVRSLKRARAEAEREAAALFGGGSDGEEDEDASDESE